MTVLLVLATLILFLIADHFVQRARLATAAQNSAAFPAGLQLASNHVWVREERGVATIGLDEFLGRVLGTVESVVLPEVGAAVTPVVMNIALCDRDRALQLAAPVTGEIVEVNRKLLKNPGLAHRDPYGAGWLMKVKADRSKGMAARFTSGPGALRWLREQTDLAKDFLAGVMTQPQLATLQDGGAPAEGILKECDASVWKEFERRFTGIPEPERTTK